MTDIKIFQGDQIGGCVTVISAVYKGTTHRIMIDYGSSLQGNNEKEDFKYPWKEEPIDAVFFTHYHGDHIGRLMEIPGEIPIYMGATARKVMINIQEALGSSKRIADADEHKKEAELLKDANRVHEFAWNGSCYDAIELPGFRIEPYSVDHSAYDIKEKLCTNEPDMLAIKYEGGNPKALVLIEVKSTESACKGEKSGIKKHMEGMKEYAEQHVFMNKRRIDAYESLLQYQRMKFIPGDVEIKEITEDLPVEKVLLLTNAEVPNSEGGEPKVSALDYLKNNVDAVAKWAKESDCKVWTTCNNYWDDKLDINMNPFGEQKGNC